jgi:MFS family permease
MAEGIAAAGARRGLGWYYGWNVVALAVLTQMTTVALAVSGFSLFLLDWSHDFHAPVSRFQLAMTVMAVFSMPSSPLAGWLCHRFPVRWIVAGALLVGAGAHLIVAFSGSAWIVVGAYVLFGFAVPISTSVPSQTLVSRWFVKRRGLALGISGLGSASAGVIFPPIIGLMMHAYGWRETWWVYAAFLAVVVVPLMLVGLRERPPPNDASGYVTGADLQDAVGEPTLSFRQIVARPNFWLLGPTLLCAFSAYMGVLANLPPLTKSHGMDAQTTVLLFSAYGLADLISKVGCGAIADRFGDRAPLVALCALGVVSAAGMAFAPGRVPLVACVLMMGLVGGIWTPIASATVAEFGRHNFSRAFGMVCVFGPATTITPWVVALTQERTGSYTTGLLILAGLTLIGMVLSLFVRERKATRTS